MPRRFALLLQFVAFAATLLGLKLWLIHSYGNEVPFWDQWDAEAAHLYQPYLRGAFSWLDLFAPHNEHRILTTRILGLLLLQINGLWSPLLEMVVNAALHALALGTSVWLMSKAANERSLAALLLFTLLLFGIPFGWENTLTGFQAQFYFVLLFSVLSIWWLTISPTFGRWWWFGIASAVMAYFSLASGVFALAAASVILLLRFIFVSRDKQELAGALLLLVLFMAGVLTTPVLELHAQLKASDAKHFFKALNLVLAWPFQISPEALKAAANEWPSLMEWLLVTARNLPALVLVCCVIWKRPARSNPVWFLVALTVWFGGQAVAVAYGRSNDALSSRYLDLHAMGVLVNFAALVAICTMSQRWLRIIAVIGGCCWILATVSALADAADELPTILDGKRYTTSVQESNVKTYLIDKDSAKFRALPFLRLPYPDADRLAGLLDSPDIRRFLPKIIQMPLQPAAIAPATESVFDRGGAYVSVPPCHCEFLGSYGAKGDAATGETYIKYDLPVASTRTGGVFALKVAGYPATAGRIDIIQGSRVRQLRFATDPREAWVERYISVRPNEPFVIRLVDSSAKGWFAVSQPVPAGRLDRLVSSLLASYGTFLAIGVAAAGLLFLVCLRPTAAKALGDAVQERIL
ncbi:hypothetical protein AX767_07490 [Variovorax sp. PAMC 28711]|nr:hypothetical protein AX767_07490 [Variovorax sp. PAMC 28711]